MSSRGMRSAAIVVLIAFPSLGCDQNRESETAIAKPQAAAAAVSLSVTDADGLRQSLERHRGKVVLVDFWATWCLPCVEQFPHTVEMARKYHDRGLAVISVSMDSPKSEPQVRAFLERQQARFENLMGSDSSPVEATKAFGLPGPVPCYRVYDREGELRREFSVDPRAVKQFTVEDVEAAVTELL